ncbi:MAG: sugar phosphate nucleotidyltransferase, partial [Acidimicrobiales bacterium]
MKAVIMAGGEGTRLRPLTSNAPKPMMPIANAPMMEHIVRLLHRHGFEEIVVTVAFMGNH